jgi:hypothetical protein
MRDHPYLKDILDEPYDRYRDLYRVWDSTLLGGLYNKHNTLLIDSDDKKVQLHLENAITNEPYSFRDV